jgi:hypothetical protein
MSSKPSARRVRATYDFIKTHRDCSKHRVARLMREAIFARCMGIACGAGTPLSFL